MSDRLAEIERLREAAGIPTPMRVVSFPGDEYGGTWELHLEGDTDVWGRDYAEAYTAEIAVYLAALVNNADWLIARVRELEAQAARWYPVLMAWRAQNDTWAEYEMLAAKEDVDDERMYVMRRAWTIGDRVLEELGKACRAALAAGEAE